MNSASALSQRIAICNETFGDWPTGKAFDYAARLGYRGVEIAPFTLFPACDDLVPVLPTLAGAQVDSLRNSAAASGLEIIGLHWLLAGTQGLSLTSSDPGARQRTTTYLIQLAELCSQLGGQVMVFGSPQQRHMAPGMKPDVADSHARQVIDGVLPWLEKYELTLALEPLGKEETNYWTTANETRAFIDSVGSPRVQLHLDIKAMATEAIPIPEIIERHRDVLCHFHANDPNRQGPGMGTVDLDPVLGRLVQSGYEGWISVEVFDYSPGIETLAESSIQNLVTSLQRAG